MKPSDYPLALWPAAASITAGHADLLILAFTALTLLLVAPIFVGITWFALYYRDGRVVNRKLREDHSRVLELGWMLIPFLLTLFFFVWGARMFDVQQHPPRNAMEISAIGRQWMWKFQHPGGQSEINDLHVPLGQPVKITMISQDVIHSLYLPALRIQMETIPGRYTQLWFNADRAGTWRLYCSEYCGTGHSKMDGVLVIMEPADYEHWLTRQGLTNPSRRREKHFSPPMDAAGAISAGRPRGRRRSFECMKIRCRSPTGASSLLTPATSVTKSSIPTATGSPATSRSCRSSRASSRKTICCA